MDLCVQGGGERHGEVSETPQPPRRGSGMSLGMPGCLYQLGAASRQRLFVSRTGLEGLAVYPRASPSQGAAATPGWEQEHWVRGERCDVWFAAGGECELFRPGLFNLQSNVFLYPAPKRLVEGPTQGSVYPLFFPWGQP